MVNYQKWADLADELDEEDERDREVNAEIKKMQIYADNYVQQEKTKEANYAKAHELPERKKGETDEELMWRVLKEHKDLGQKAYM